MTIYNTQERLQERLADRYLVERELGKGGMATVYLAKDIRHDREVAIKVLHPELAASIGGERFQREIKLSAKLQHPNILGLIDSGEADGLLYYVMPFVKGESLRDRLDREGQLPVEDAIQITLEVADALGHAHSMGIIHRDIKPENILISGGHALVADFGIARAATEAGGHKLTQTGMAVGTPVYMAPEQSVGDAINQTADLYSLGCVLYEMLAGEPPFTAKNPQALMARHAMEAVPSIRIVRNTVPEEVEDAIFAVMAKVPADRPQSAVQFAEFLGVQLGATASRRAAIRHTASRRVPTGVHRMVEAPPRWWRKPWVTGAAVLVLAGGAFAAWQAFAGPRPASLNPTELARAKRIAVLYFVAPDTTLRDVADGLTESLIRSLKSVSGLSVRPRESVRPYRNTETPRDSIARALDVGTVIEGSVEPSGRTGINVTARLLDASDAQLGRVGVTVSRDSLFQAPDSIASLVAQELQKQLGTEMQLRATQAGARSQGAWTLYQRGERLRKDAEVVAATDPARAAAALTQADSLLREATAQDREWIDPVLLRAELIRQRSLLERDNKPERNKWLDSALVIVGRAGELDPGNARAMALHGTIRYAQWRLDISPDAAARAALLDEALRDLEGAVSKDGSLASAFATLSSVYFDKKDVPTALSKARDAYEADAFLSNSDLILDRMFWGNHNTEQFSEAAKWCQEGGRRFPKDYRFAACPLWMLLTPDAVPAVQEAWRLAARVDSLAPVTSRGFQSHLARMVVGGVIGRAAKDLPASAARTRLADSARKVMDRALGDRQIDPTQELVGYKAIMLTQMGEYDEAVALLKDYVALNKDHSFRIGTNVHWWWKDLKNHPGFQVLMARGN